MAQRIETVFLRPTYPLAHRAFGHTKSFGDRFLFPALLIQLPGTQASIFAPVVGKRFFCTHTSFHRLACFITLGPHAEVNDNL